MTLRHSWRSLLFLSCALPVSAADSTKWLAVAASSKALEPVLHMARTLRPAVPQTAVVQSADCANLAPDLYLAIAAASPDRAAAEAVAAKIRKTAPDAYVRECRLKPGSLLAFGLPLVDPSVFAVPATAVNWTDRDRLSSIAALPEGGYVWFRRTYQPAPEDVREGRRTAVSFFSNSPKQPVVLSTDCTGAEFSSKAGRIALSCARETAGDQLFHETSVFDTATGKKLFSASRCRDPKLTSAAQLTCSSEEVDQAGALRLTPRQVALP